ncbi:hypothetical protein NIES4101_39660 [Calothrix sp. NIES-4101]|nr:hypothetical protein NIES4101_39660 [Calothrix sp. NIES-4101]
MHINNPVSPAASPCLQVNLNHPLIQQWQIFQYLSIAAYAVFSLMKENPRPNIPGSIQLLCFFSEWLDII